MPGLVAMNALSEELGAAPRRYDRFRKGCGGKGRDKKTRAKEVKSRVFKDWRTENVHF